MHDDTVTTSWRRFTDKVNAASPAHAATATAPCRTNRDGEATQQAARLATWEDEGGTTSS